MKNKTLSFFFHSKPNWRVLLNTNQVSSFIYSESITSVATVFLHSSFMIIVLYCRSMRFPARRVLLIEQDTLSLLEQRQRLCDGKRDQSSTVDLGSSPDRALPKTIKLACVAFPPSQNRRR